MTRSILAFAVWISLLAPSAFAQETVKQFITLQGCTNVSTITSRILSEYGETPMFSGWGNQMSAQDGEWYSSSMMYFVNQDSGTWSLVSLYADGMGCLVASGFEFAPYTGP